MKNIVPARAPLALDAVDLDASRKRIYSSTKQEIERMVAEYGTTTQFALETRHWEKLDSILDATDRMAALDLAKAAREKVHMTLLVLAQRRKIPGKQDPDALERKAEANARFIELNEQKGNTEAAEKVRQRVNKLRVQAQQLREGQAPTSEPKKPRRRK